MGGIGLIFGIVMAASQDTATLRRIGDVHLLSAQAADLHMPVRVQGTVTVGTPNTNGFYVQDRAGAVYVHTEGSVIVQPGDLVQIDGVTAAGRYAPMIDLAKVRMLGRRALPGPIPATAAGFQLGSLACKYAEIRGVVRRASISGPAQLVIVDGGTRLDVKIESGSVSDKYLRDIIGATVRIRGVPGYLFNARRQAINVRFRLHSWKDVVVLHSIRRDLDLPLTPLSSLFLFDPLRVQTSRLRVSGVVTYRAGEKTFIQEGPHALELSGALDAAPLGRQVEVIGFPAFGETSSKLEDAIVIEVGPAKRVEPRHLTTESLAAQPCGGELATLDGVVRSRVSSFGQTQLRLTFGTAFVWADLAEPLTGHLDNGTHTSARISLTGVCEDRMLNRLPSPLLHARSSSDIRILKSPPWFTRERAVQAMYILLGLTAIAVILMAALRRRVRLQTKFIENRLQMEAALEQRYRDLFENATDLIFTLDRNGYFLAANRATEHAFAYSRMELEGKKIWELVPPGDEEAKCRDLIWALPGGQPTSLFQTRIQTACGSEIVIEVNCRLQHTPEGSGYIEAIGRDVTERKRAEASYEIALDNAEAASRAKSEFLANISHEIRTPLNGILGMTDLVLEGQLDTQQRAHAEVIKKSAESLLDVVNDVLDYSKVEAGKMELHSSEFSLQTMLEASASYIALEVQQKGVALICDVDPDLPDQLIGDPIRLRQILTNLLGNAAKFTTSGQIVLSAESVANGGGGRCLVRFSVSDTGIGISPVDHGRIFQSFSQCDGSSSRMHGGTGLGLAIASKLARLMQSSIEIESQVGAGSNFSFTVRLGTPALEQASAPTFGSGLVAVVDEANERSRAAICRTLTAAGFLCLKPGQSREAPAVAIDGIGSDWPCPVVTLGDVACSSQLSRPVLPAKLLAAVRCAVSGEEFKVQQPAPAIRDRYDNQTPLTILLAEDNAVNRMLATHTLEREGYRITTASNGLEAVELAQQVRFDLILMDVQMPGMDGFQATARIRQFERQCGRQATTIVAVTAHAMAGDRERCLSAGMDDYLSKPLRASDLLRIATSELVSRNRAIDVEAPGFDAPGHTLAVLDSLAT